MNAAVGLVLFVALGGLFIFLTMRYGLGRLPGDIVVNRENFAFYLPITSGILVSLLLSLAFWLFSR
jgi:hypothetical protein